MKKELIDDNKRLKEENKELKEEIERLIISLQAQEELTMNEHIKVEKLRSIIKEVREYIEKTKFKYCDDELCYMVENHYNRILEILEKENK